MADIGRLIRDHIDHAAKKAARAPSDGQKEAGNYRKGRIRLHGLDISIENPRGSTRSGTDRNGKRWSVALPDHYGYIRRTEGSDGDHVDCYIGRHPLSSRVFVIDQVDADTGKHDEFKTMLGYTGQAQALAAYRRAFSDGRGNDRIGSVKAMDIAQFKRWLHRESGLPAYATGGGVPMAEGGAPPDAFNPAEFAAFKKATPADATPVAPPVSSAFTPAGDFDPAAFEAFKKEQPKPAASNSLVEGGKGLARGALNFLGDMGEAVAGPFGPTRQTMRAMDAAPEPTPEELKQYGSKAAYLRSKAVPTYGQQMEHGLGVDSTKPGYAGSIGEVLGNPASYFGPGGWLAKTLLGTATGAGGETAARMAEGTGYEGPARVAGSLAGGPLAARVMKPQLAPAQQALADAGVTQMTPGQLTGGILKDFEDKLSSVPLLGHFIQNARGRSIESFNRAVGNQALEPIGQRLAPRTEPGHATVAEVERRLGSAYDALKPQINFLPDRQYMQDIDTIVHRDVALLPEPQVNQFTRLMDTRLGAPAPMDGTMFKKVESEMTHFANNYRSSADPAQRDLGRAVDGVVRAMRSNLERANPAHAEELHNINSGWAMFARMRDAAANRRTSEGVFTPSDLLAAVKRGDKSAGKGSFARGDALMQDFAEAGQRVLPSKVPDSGTPGRAMVAGLTGLALGEGSHLIGHPGLMAAAGAAVAPYLTPSMALLNRYTRATPASPGTLASARAQYSDLGRGAGMVRPFIQENPFGEWAHPYTQP